MSRRGAESLRHAGASSQALSTYLRATRFTITERYNRIFAANADADYAGRLREAASAPILGHPGATADTQE
jgi:hypothetical protein